MHIIFIRVFLLFSPNRACHGHRYHSPYSWDDICIDDLKTNMLGQIDNTIDS